MDLTSAEAYDFDLTRFSYSEQHRRERDFFVHEDTTGTVHFFDCSQETAVPYPSCETHLDYNDQVRVEISFSRDYLRNWRDIETKVLDLVATFETKD